MKKLASLLTDLRLMNLCPLTLLSSYRSSVSFPLGLQGMDVGHK